MICPSSAPSPHWYWHVSDPNSSMRSSRSCRSSVSAAASEQEAAVIIGVDRQHARRPEVGGRRLARRGALLRIGGRRLARRRALRDRPRLSSGANTSSWATGPPPGAGLLLAREASRAPAQARGRFARVAEGHRRVCRAFENSKGGLCRCGSPRLRTVSWRRARGRRRGRGPAARAGCTRRRLPVGGRSGSSPADGAVLDHHDPSVSGGRAWWLVKDGRRRAARRAAADARAWPGPPGQDARPPPPRPARRTRRR